MTQYDLQPVLKRKSCHDCQHENQCYPIALGSDLFPRSVPEYFNAIRQRDLCFYNNKVDFTLRKDFLENRNA